MLTPPNYHKNRGPLKLLRSSLADWAERHRITVHVVEDGNYKGNEYVFYDDITPGAVRHELYMLTDRKVGSIAAGVIWLARNVEHKLEDGNPFPNGSVFGPPMNSQSSA